MKNFELGALSLLVNGIVSRGRYPDFARQQNLEVIQKIVLISRFLSPWEWRNHYLLGKITIF